MPTTQSMIAVCVSALNVFVPSIYAMSCSVLKVCGVGSDEHRMDSMDFVR